ncbi:MAG: hypothetical protein ACKOC1_04305 [Hyphomicrobiales bacterium]
MADEPENLTLKFLRRIDEKLDRVAENVHMIKVRLTSVGESLVGIIRRVDRIEDRMDRIERPLDLAGAAE